MFTMTIHWHEAGLDAEGPSREGEDWEATLLRLFQGLAGDGLARRISAARFRADAPGCGESHLVRDAGPAPGPAHPEAVVTFRTDPPQPFA